VDDNLCFAIQKQHRRDKAAKVAVWFGTFFALEKKTPLVLFVG